MATEPELAPLFLLSDEPIAEFAADGLAMQEHARVIASAALGAGTPFTIGVFGAWGHGKTSLLNAARTLLDRPPLGQTSGRAHPHVITVEFNAWRYEREAHPIVPLVATIARAIQKRLDDDASFVTAVGDKGRAFAEKAVDGALSLLSATKLDFKGRVGHSAVSKAEGGISVDAGAVQEDFARRQADRAGAKRPTIQEWIDDSLYLSAFDDLAKLFERAKQDEANVTHQSPVIVVFIDDLDRCRPEKAVEILEGIKLVLAQPGFVFVLALYREVIERYLERESEIRFGEDNKVLGKGYIDKIVQLPLTLRSHEHEFETFVTKLIEDRVKPGLLPVTTKAVSPAFASTVQLLAAINRCAPLLAQTSEYSPRKLIRRINELLIDDRLLPSNAHIELKCRPEARRGVLFPLCLIQRSLMELQRHERMKALMQNNDLCTALADYRKELTDKVDADDNTGPMLFRRRLKDFADWSENTFGKNPDSPPEDVEPPVKGLDRPTALRWLRATDCLSEEVRRAVLLNTSAGREWLRNHIGRRIVSAAVASRPSTSEGSIRWSGSASALLSLSPAAIAWQYSNLLTDTPELREQISIIERAIRETLAIGQEVELGAPELARIRELNIGDEPITDAGVAWLARPDSGLVNLSTLKLGRTSVGDPGAAALGSEGIGLKSLETLYLDSTRLTDIGAIALSRPSSLLKQVSKLSLSLTRVGDVGARAILGDDSGLKGLTNLYLASTGVTEELIREMGPRRPKLSIHYSPVRDPG